MPNPAPTPSSLIALCRQNPLLRYVTIKEGYQGAEIYIFKYKQPATKEGFSNNFWYAFITPGETIIVLGHETSRRTLNYAHTITYCNQQTVFTKTGSKPVSKTLLKTTAGSDPPFLFLYAAGDNAAIIFPLESLLKTPQQ